MNVSGSLLQQWFGQSVQWDFSVHRKSGRQLRVQREMTHSRCGAAGKCDTRRHSSQIQPRISNITFLWELLSWVAWHFVGAHSIFSKRWKRGGNVICGATPFLQLRLNLVLSVHDFTFSWHCVNFGIYAASAEWQRGDKKSSSFWFDCGAYRFLLLVPCSPLGGK